MSDRDSQGAGGRGDRQATRRPFFRRRKTCPFSGDKADRKSVV